MSLKIAPPFPFVPRLADAVHVDPYEASLRRLRDAVTGKDAALPASQAMALLDATDFPNKHHDFAAVLEDEKQAPELRCIAAAYLGKTASPAARRILIRNSTVRDELVLAGVMRALGCIGDRSAFDAVSQTKRNAHGIALRNAGFAQILIAHREGLDNVELDAMEQAEPLRPDPQSARHIEISQAGIDDAELCLRSLADRPYGIEFAEQPMIQLRCGRNAWMIVFNHDCLRKDGLEDLFRKRAFLGAIALRNQETGLYAAIYLMLTAPAAGKHATDIRIYRTSGRLDFAGGAAIKDGRADFSVVSLRRDGAFPALVEGVFDGYSMQIRTALAAGRIGVPKHHPVEVPAAHYQASQTAAT
ncbi:hypothetical protein EGT07_10965 [Herbaspirillum sp. HC18]|nr:hypothetical protein EGT07_10965 [Herbaspirillum sp. HC18]